jgi:hypothetical protein
MASPDPGRRAHKTKIRWSLSEDEALVRALQKERSTDWKKIALSVKGRTAKQCRERWVGKLSPAFRADPWSPEEDATLVRLQRVYGNQWVVFRGHLPGRSSIAIRNRWCALVRRGFPPDGDRADAAMGLDNSEGPKLDTCPADPATFGIDAMM